MRINVFELLLEWIVPIVGAFLTGLALRSAGLTSFWWMLLALPGALLFQWTIVLLWLGVAKLLEPRPPRGDG